jgi:hypothetical protein
MTPLLHCQSGASFFRSDSPLALRRSMNFCLNLGSFRLTAFPPAIRIAQETCRGFEHGMQWTRMGHAVNSPQSRSK